MTLIPTSKVYQVYGITDNERERICDFLQGAVYTWCTNRRNEWFSMRDLAGGGNRDWSNTPLIALYTKQVNAGKSDAEAQDQAGKESGWLLKRVLADDCREFEHEKADLIRRYRWIP